MTALKRSGTSEPCTISKRNFGPLRLNMKEAQTFALNILQGTDEKCAEKSWKKLSKKS